MENMIRVIFLLILLAIADRTQTQTRDLVEEAEYQLQQLRALVELDILAAFDDLNELVADFNIYSTNLYESGSLDIQQEQESVYSQLNTVKDLAQSSGKDISFCTNNREEILNDLPSYHKNEMAQCIARVNSEGLTIINNSRYIIDTTINKVHDLENQFRLCREDILCIEPLIEEVRRYKAILPLNIKVQVQTTEELLTTLELSVDECTRQNIAQYVSEANSVLSDIVECANELK